MPEWLRATLILVCVSFVGFGAMYAIVWATLSDWSLRIPSLLVRSRRKQAPSWDQTVKPQEVSEQALLQAQMEGLAACREFRKMLKTDLDMIERRIEELEAKLEQPQGDAYRGQIPAAKANTS